MRCADKCVERIKSGEYDVVILNFANCDMVGHTGVLRRRHQGRGNGGRAAWAGWWMPRWRWAASP